MVKMFLGAALALSLGTGMASAAEWTVGLGAVDLWDDTRDVQLSLEARSEPMGHLMGTDIAPQIGLTLDTSGATYLGIGAAATSWVGSAWFVEGSLMMGYYNSSDDRTELGTDLELRPLIGVGRDFGEFGRVSAAFSHITNMGPDDRGNSGTNALSLRLTRGF